MYERFSARRWLKNAQIGHFDVGLNFRFYELLVEFVRKK